MRQFILFLFLASFCCAISQTQHPDGPYQEFYDSGELKKEGQYKNNKKNGVFKEYFKSGQLKLTGFYSNGNKVRNWQGYYENGQLRTVNAYGVNGKPTGIGQSYSESGVLTKETKRSPNGGLIRKEYYEDGHLLAVYALNPSKNNGFVKAGGYKEYYKNGTLKIDALYEESELKGIWSKFYETGEKEWEVYYVNGYKDGSYKHYYKNGQLKLEGLCKLNQKEGDEYQYDTNGNHINTLKYKKGELKKVTNKTSLRVVEVPDGVIEHFPVYPGCDVYLREMELRNCMSQNISKFVFNKFNTSFAGDMNLDGKQKIYVIFKIDETGGVKDIRARAAHRALEAEATRVIALLPKMKPGLVRGNPVELPFSLPIVFKI